MKNHEIKSLDLIAFREAMNDSRPTVVKFYNPNCHLCVGLRPIFKNLASKYQNDFNFATLDVTNGTNSRIAKVFKIDGVPEIYVIMNGYVKNVQYPSDEIANNVSGYPKDYLIQQLDSILSEIKHIRN